VKVGIIGKLWKRSAVGWFIESCSKCRSFKLFYVVSKNFLPATARIRSKAAISYRNSLLSQKSRCYVNEGRALNDLILSHCTEIVRILTATTMNVCHLWPPHKCHVICKFSANGTTRVEVRNLEISFLRKVVREHVGLPVQTWSTGIENYGIKNIKCKITKTRTGCPFVFLLQRKRKLCRIRPAGWRT